MKPDTIIAVGSVDGVLTTAALLEETAPGAEILFCQPHLLPAITFSGREVALVDLAVNVRDPLMTADWLRDLVAADNTLVAVIDEHDREAWRRAFDVAGLSDLWDGLAIRPVSQADGVFTSSGGLLMARLVSLSDHARSLCLAADAADRLDFDDVLARRANGVIKSDIRSADNRVRLARELAASLEPTAWQRELCSRYDQIQKLTRDIAERAVEDHGVLWARAPGSEIDMTACFVELYRRADVAVIETLGGARLTIGTSRADIDLLAAAREARADVPGFEKKITLSGDALENLRG